jgi:acyl-CoA thioesterase FadM
MAPAATNARLELPLVVSEAHIVYRLPIAAMVPIAVGVRTTRLGRASLVLEYAVRAAPKGSLYATGDTTIVCVDLATGRPRGLPPWTRDAVRRLDALS